MTYLERLYHLHVVLMKIAMLCRDTEITNFVDSLDDLDQLLQSASPVVGQFFAGWVGETFEFDCRKLKNI